MFVVGEKWGCCLRPQFDVGVKGKDVWIELFPSTQPLLFHEITHLAGLDLGTSRLLLGLSRSRQMACDLEAVRISSLPADAFYISDFISEDEEEWLLQKVGHRGVP